MAISKIITMRVLPAAHERWRRCAEASSLSFNAWAIRALNEAAALDEIDLADAHKPLPGFTPLETERSG